MLNGKAIAVAVALGMLLVAAPALARYRVTVVEYEDKTEVSRFSFLPTEEDVRPFPKLVGEWSCYTSLEVNGLAMHVNCVLHTPRRVSVGASALPERPAALYLHLRPRMWRITIDFPTREG